MSPEMNILFVAMQVSKHLGTTYVASCQEELTRDP